MSGRTGWLERVAWTLGASLVLAGALLTWVGPRLARESLRLSRPVESRSTPAAPAPAVPATGRPPARRVPGVQPSPDHGRSDWSAGRVRAWQAALTQRSRLAPTGAIRIPRLDIDAAVFPGTSDLELDLGAGHIEGTAAPGSAGNFAVAGHRDGLFRRLEQVRPGDEIDVRDRTGRRFVYRVASMRVVTPEDTRVLDDSGAPSITLVTCYPFHFLGEAPQRFVVRGVLVRGEPVIP
jgi:LPXTG-site transpeptidase (sortase) family protein